MKGGRPGGARPSGARPSGARPSGARPSGARPNTAVRPRTPVRAPIRTPHVHVRIGGAGHGHHHRSPIGALATFLVMPIVFLVMYMMIFVQHAKNSNTMTYCIIGLVCYIVFITFVLIMVSKKNAAKAQQVDQDSTATSTTTQATTTTATAKTEKAADKCPYCGCSLTTGKSCKGCGFNN